MTRSRRRWAAAALAALGMLSSAVAVGATATAAGAVDGLSSLRVKVLDLPSNDVAYDRPRDSFLVTVPGSDEAFGNELVALDPSSGAVRSRLDVGSEPGPIALSDDGSTAYVTLYGANLVAEVDLSSFTMTRRFPVRGAERGWPVVADLVVVPGRSDTVVVSVGPEYIEGAYAYRDGVELPEHAEGYPVGPRLELVSATHIFSYDGLSFDAEQLLEITPNGVRLGPRPVFDDETGGGYTDFELSGGKLYSNEGRRLDPATGHVDRFAEASGALEVVPAVQQVAYVDSGGVLRVYSTATRALVGQRWLGYGAQLGADLSASRGSFALAGGSGTVLFGPGVTGTGFVRPPDPPSSVGDLEEVALGEGVGALSYDPQRDQLYLARSTAKLDGGWVEAVDPMTGQVLRTSPPLSSGPLTAAISDDASTLYVALRDHTIVRLALQDLSVVHQFDVPPGWDGAAAVDQIVVRPGSPQTIAVSFDLSSFGIRSVRSYVHGVAQPGWFSGNGVAFAGPARLYAGHQRLTMDGAGVLHDPAPDRVAIPSTGARYWVVEDRAYADEGEVTDLGEELVVGTLGAPIWTFGDVVPAPDHGRVYALGGYGLEELDLGRLRLVGRNTELLTPHLRSLLRTRAGFAAIGATAGIPGRLVLLRVDGPPQPSGLSHVAGGATASHEVTIRGDRLAWATKVTVGGAAVPFEVVDDGALRTTIPPGPQGAAEVVVHNEAGASAPVTFDRLAEPPLVPLAPVRLLDTRPGSRVGPATGAPADGKVIHLPVAGRAGVPAEGAAAAALSVTLTGGQPGYVTVWDCADERPASSSVNATDAGQTVANLALAALSDTGEVCLYAQRATHVVVDVTGWLPHGTGYTPVAPTRLLDTRASGGPDGRVWRVQVGGEAEVPAADVGAVVLNVTTTGTLVPGWVTVWPCDQPRPSTSNLNVDRAGQTAANLVATRPGADGQVCLGTSGSGHLVVDVLGWWPTGPVSDTSAARLLDTRAPFRTGYGGGFPAAGTTVQVQVTGRAGVLPGAGAALLNVTATGARGPGWVTAWPCGQPRPATSNLNVERAGHTVAVLAAVGIGSGGKVCLWTSGGTDLVVDLVTWLPKAGTSTT